MAAGKGVGARMPGTVDQVEARSGLEVDLAPGGGEVEEAIFIAGAQRLVAVGDGNAEIHAARAHPQRLNPPKRETVAGEARVRLPLSLRSTVIETAIPRAPAVAVLGPG
ncbi:MAG TPA: hypothetical protein VD846_02025 [Allosphingosinicella sp.]|nr:hypothetical protein [Allosphingosinicella sp.]